MINMKANKSIHIILALLLLSSCGKEKTLGIGEYIAHVESEEAGLLKKKQVDGWIYKIQYKPAEYILLHERLDEKSYEQRKKDLTGTIWFNIAIQHADGQAGPLRYKAASHAEYEQRYNYFLTRAKDNLYVQYGTAKLYPINYLFETSYNIAPKATMVVGFALPENETGVTRDIQLVYQDRLFHHGIIKTIFNKKDILSLPQLKQAYE